ncbi:glycerate kinase [Curvibacter sp. CHRR-16]|uniref:glycerate kinase type-2 family protein n=1 Tax=Curvibacter sp. CHRR-16 TaxID=2835872 RepID=UPI001BD9CB98|nr:glycerate kinase [Curvibacter sp. CHRR-16]MBT0569687.1 glycerate kinase [Curvibacter sp. CHRR-16]
MTALPPRDIPARQLLRALYDAAVARAQAAQVLPAHLPPPPAKGRTVVVGAGKAAAAMAQAVEAAWPASAPLSGVVVTRYGHIPPQVSTATQRIRILEAAHPVPDAAGVAASQQILQAVQGLTADDLVIVLMSGGASSLLVLPVDGVDLEAKRRINQQLLHSGAPIDAMNCVRKHLSRIKGGQLAAACHPARVLTLAISDVPGDDPATIGSGPSVADPSTCAEALAIVEQYRIDIPPAIRQAWASGLLETIKPADARLAQCETRVVAAPWQSLQAAAAVAQAAGYTPYLLGDNIEGESREIGRMHAALALSCAQRGQPFQTPCVLLSGGETTVTVAPRAAHEPRGKGGRAAEFCLGLAQGLAGGQTDAVGIWALAADTDGIDGSEDNAGAFVTPDTLQRARQQGLRLEQYLARNDSYSYFAQLGDLLVTGPTHTNVNDFRAVVIV